MPCFLTFYYCCSSCCREPSVIASDCCLAAFELGTYSACDRFFPTTRRPPRPIRFHLDFYSARTSFFTSSRSLFPCMQRRISAPSGCGNCAFASGRVGVWLMARGRLCAFGEHGGAPLCACGRERVCIGDTSVHQSESSRTLGPRTFLQQTKGFRRTTNPNEERRNAAKRYARSYVLVFSCRGCSALALCAQRFTRLEISALFGYVHDSLRLLRIRCNSLCVRCILFSFLSSSNI